MTRLLATGLCTIGSMLLGKAQTPAVDSLLLGTNSAFVEQQDAWLTCHNAAGLTRLSCAGHLSDAQMTVAHDWGPLADYHEAPSATTYSAQAASYYRIGPHTVLYGSMAYDHLAGRNMAGSAFIDPTRQPFDIVEDSLGNTGSKHRDTYHLTGAVGTDLGRLLTVGLKADFRAANYAKYKDLRHKNTLMDLTLSAGLRASVGSLLIGADVSYRRNTESLRFATYGKGDNVYKSLIAYAAFMGDLETFGDNGYTDKSREMPLLSEHTGADVQLSSDMAGGWAWWCEMSYRRRSGYYGKRSPYTISYSEHRSHIYGCHGRLTLKPSAAATHHLDVALEVENLENMANSYREATDDNTAYYYEYFTPVKTANKLWTIAQACYTAHWGLRRQTPAWTLTASAQWTTTRQTGYVYPYYRRQELSTQCYGAALRRNVALRHSLLTATVALDWQDGAGAPMTDGTLATPSDKQTAPPSMDDYLYRHHDYVTARRIGCETRLRYAIALPAIGMKPYAELQYRLCRARNVSWLDGSLRQHIGLTIGTTFI